MTPADRKRLERLAEMAGKLADAMKDAHMRGIIGEWKGSTGRQMTEDLLEFHDWQLGRLRDDA